MVSESEVELMHLCLVLTMRANVYVQEQGTSGRWHASTRRETGLVGGILINKFWCVKKQIFVAAMTNFAIMKYTLVSTEPSLDVAPLRREQNDESFGN